MARVTVEDCLANVSNRFELVLLGGFRARQISQGASATIARDNDKNPVVALREIAEKSISAADLKEDLIHSLQKHVEVDEPEKEEKLLLSSLDGAADSSEREVFTFENMREEDLLAGIEGLIAPEKSEDF